MDVALYDPDIGYYARAAQRSGRAGDFFTSVDVGPLFGELLETQLAEMHQILRSSEFRVQSSEFDLVEAGAGNGRLSADILRAARRRDSAFYQSIRLHLVEASAAARAGHHATLAEVAERLASSSASLPESFEGVLVANELLDALPVHQVVMREEGLREIYVVASRQSPVVSQPSSVASQPSSVPSLMTIEGPLSTPALAEYIAALDVRLEPGWRVEINLRAVDWVRDAARRLVRGFMIFIDYGHDARELYSATHSAGTLTTFASHRSAGPESAADEPVWLRNPGEQDLTAHVDFTSIRAAAEAEGFAALGFLDQTYFVLGLVDGWSATALAERAGAMKTLIMPGGLGSTHKVLILGKGVGTPTLRGCSFKVRVT